MLAQYKYGPFGEVIRASGPACGTNPFRFSTKYQDDETDLLYYGYRYYNASTGRWISRDPIGELAGLNLIGFVKNDSVGKADADGRDIIERCSLCGAAYHGSHQCSPEPTRIQACVRDINKSGGGCLNYCALSIANIVGHGFLALTDGKGGIVDTRGSRFDWADAGSGPWPEPQPISPRACTQCIRTEAPLKHGAGSEAGKTGQTASESEIWECITKHTLKRHYGGFSYNCNDWVKEAAQACGIRCP
jgi:RHS repeat-associated protein